MPKEAYKSEKDKVINKIYKVKQSHHDRLVAVADSQSAEATKKVSVSAVVRDLIEKHTPELPAN